MFVDHVVGVAGREGVEGRVAFDYFFDGLEVVGVAFADELMHLGFLPEVVYYVFCEVLKVRKGRDYEGWGFAVDAADSFGGIDDFALELLLKGEVGGAYGGV